MKRCVACIMQKELAKVREEITKEIEPLQARTAAADKMIGSLQVYWVCMYVPVI